MKSIKLTYTVRFLLGAAVIVSLSSARASMSQCDLETSGEAKKSTASIAVYQGSDDPAWNMRVRRLQQAAKDSIEDREITVVEFERFGAGPYRIGTDEFQFSSSFAVSKSPVSRMAWREIVDEAQIMFSRKYDDLPRRILGAKAVAWRDTTPMRGISKVQIERWLDAVNELRAINSPVIRKIFPGLKKRDVLSLPTADELLVAVPVPIRSSMGGGVFEWTIDPLPDRPGFSGGPWFNTINLARRNVESDVPNRQEKPGGSFHLVIR